MVEFKIFTRVASESAVLVMASQSGLAFTWNVKPSFVPAFGGSRSSRRGLFHRGSTSASPVQGCFTNIVIRGNFSISDDNYENSSPTMAKSALLADMSSLESITLDAIYFFVFDISKCISAAYHISDFANDLTN